MFISQQRAGLERKSPWGRNKQCLLRKKEHYASMIHQAPHCERPMADNLQFALLLGTAGDIIQSIQASFAVADTKNYT